MPEESRYFSFIFCLHL